jgi:hypothetical protein
VYVITLNLTKSDDVEKCLGSDDHHSDSEWISSVDWAQEHW